MFKTYNFESQELVHLNLVSKMKGTWKNEPFNGGCKQTLQTLIVKKIVKPLYICMQFLCAPLHIIPIFIYIYIYTHISYLSYHTHSLASYSLSWLKLLIVGRLVLVLVMVLVPVPFQVQNAFIHFSHSIATLQPKEYVNEATKLFVYFLFSAVFFFLSLFWYLFLPLRYTNAKNSSYHTHICLFHMYV